MKLPAPFRTALPFALATGLLAPALTQTEAQAGPDARGIMEKVTVTRKLDGSEAVIKMNILNEKGQSRERKISMATKLFDGGKTEKRIYRFLSPADVEGTGVLVFDYEAQADDVWVFLPALRKTRRIVSSQRSQSFMGSEFSYGDLNIPALDDFTYQLVKEESFGDEDCYVVDVLPKTPQVAEGEGYSKKTYWVSKAKFAVRRGLYYDLQKKLLKELLSNDLKLLDAKNKRYRPMHMEMVNKQNGRRSVFDSEKVSFAPDTKEEFFTTRYLERQ
ncbi:MAG TPA: outer membrane lipoprotein-sorting protein [Polyangiaceae bacterium]|nr:outer membrane lipoprotein-sorting protein [Polyangiaceae bacterium]